MEICAPRRSVTAEREAAGHPVRPGPGRPALSNSLPDPLPAIGRRHRQVVDQPPSAVPAPQHRAHQLTILLGQQEQVRVTFLFPRDLGP